MNKRQKEVAQAQLNNEKAVLKSLETSYKDALGEINSKIELLLARQDADMQHVIYQIEYQKALKSQVQGILDKLQANEFETISEYLAKSYEDGFFGTMYDLQGQGVPLIMPIDQEDVVKAIQHDTKLSTNLYTALGKDIKVLKTQIAGEISRGIASGLMYNDIARNIADYAGISKNRAMTISRTEGHRIQIHATATAQNRAKAKGADVVKQWDSTLDGKTRSSHSKLDGQIRELEDSFEVDGLKVMYPGNFGRPEEDINCRCGLLQRARWNLGNDYTKWSKDAPVIIDDDGTTQYSIIGAKNFESFKKQYKQASERVRESAQKMSDDEQAKVDARKAAWKARQKQTVLNDSSKVYNIPNFDEMQHSDIVKWADSNLKTTFEDIKGVNKDYYRETVKALAEFEAKMGGKTIEGLSIKYGGNIGSNYAKYDDKTKTLLLKKTGTLQSFEEAMKQENARYKIKWHTDKDYHATTSYKGTIYHELGHAVDTETGQALSRKLSNDAKLFESSTKISAYAGSSQGVRVTPRSEAWAENFAAYMEGGNKAKEVPEEIRSMIEGYFKRDSLENIGKSSTIDLDLQFFAKKHKTKKVPNDDPLWDSLVKGDVEQQLKDGIFEWEHGGYDYLIEITDKYSYNTLSKKKKRNIHE